MFDIDVKTS